MSQYGSARVYMPLCWQLELLEAESPNTCCLPQTGLELDMSRSTPLETKADLQTGLLGLATGFSFSCIATESCSPSSARCSAKAGRFPRACIGVMTGFQSDFSRAGCERWRLHNGSEVACNQISKPVGFRALAVWASWLEAPRRISE